MNIYFRLVIVFLAAMAACGSASTSQGYRPATPPPSDTAAAKKEKPRQEPEKKKEKEKPAQKTKKDEPKTFTVSLLLPLNIGSDGVKADPAIANYYEGILMGLDSLKKLDMDIVVNVYDSKNDTAVVRKLTWKKELAESDLIIGPTFKAGYAILSKYVAPRKIALVSPFSNANMWSDSNYYSMYCSPDDKSYAAALAQHIKENYPDANLLLFNDDTKEDKDFLWRFKVAAREIGVTEWKDITYKSGWDITPHLKKADEEENIIIAPTDNEKISQLLLTQLKDASYNNTLFVMDSWLSFKNTNYQTYSLWQQNNLHILAPYFIDDYSVAVVRFKNAYLERFGALPDEFAFRGYDHIVSLGTARYQYDSACLATAVKDQELPALHTRFKFIFNGRAMENSGINIIRFTNYRFERVDP